MRRYIGSFGFGIVVFMLSMASVSAAPPQKTATPAEGRSQAPLHRLLRQRDRREERQSRIAAKLEISVESLVAHYDGALTSVSQAAEAWSVLQTRLASFQEVVEQARNEEPIHGTADQVFLAAEAMAIALDIVAAEAQASDDLDAATQRALQALIEKQQDTLEIVSNLTKKIVDTALSVVRAQKD